MDTQIQVLDRLRTAFRSGVTLPEQFRRSELNQLMSMLKENEQLIVDALHKDLAKVEICVHVMSMHCFLNSYGR